MRELFAPDTQSICYLLVKYHVFFIGIHTFLPKHYSRDFFFPPQGPIPPALLIFAQKCPNAFQNFDLQETRTVPVTDTYIPLLALSNN